jgi:hypothetical protein
MTRSRSRGERGARGKSYDARCSGNRATWAGKTKVGGLFALLSKYPQQIKKPRRTAPGLLAILLRLFLRFSSLFTAPGKHQNSAHTPCQDSVEAGFRNRATTLTYGVGE